MQTKIVATTIPLVLIFIGCAISSLVFLYFTHKKMLFIDRVTVSENTTSVFLPVRLKIPSINVDAHVEHVGLTSDGAMDVPKGPADVAWFSLGSRPGENGSAVIAGHYGSWKNGQGSVFDDLHTLHAGDIVHIEDEKGVQTVFVVRKIRIYGKDEDASSVFGSADGKAHLNLVTCTGVWNEVEKTLSDRLVVFTDKK